MTKKTMGPHSRGIQILKLLAKHGALSVRGLSTLLQPPIHRRRLREALKRLQDNGHVLSKQKGLFGGSAVFYQLNQDHEGWARSLSKTDLPVNTIRPPYFRRQDAIHSELCAIWSEKLKMAFPEATILRDHEVSRCPEALRKLLSGKQDFELRPDLLLLASRADGSGQIAIAVEIERNHKSETRLVTKLRKYAGQSLLDGLVYICDQDAISERLRHIYNSRILASDQRIKHYGQNFFLFSYSTAAQQNGDFIMHNASLRPTSLNKWMRELANVAMNARRDQTFDVRPSGAG